MTGLSAFPSGPHRRLLAACGVEDPDSWAVAWRQRLEWHGWRPGAIDLSPSLVWGLALPLLARCAQGAGTGKRWLIGLNGPVGAGKTTLARCLEQLAPLLGSRLAVVSIDDAYRPWEERRNRLAGNPFGVDRVPPGSHDVALLLERIRIWREGGALDLPRFDKRLRQGSGDRSGWERLEADVLVLEGWLLGCRPLGSEELARQLSKDRAARFTDLSPEEWLWLPRWDEALAGYVPLWSELDALWQLRPTDWSLPRRWRFQAEARQRRRSGAGLDGAALNRLVRASLGSLPPDLYQDPLWREPHLCAGQGREGRCADGCSAEAVMLLDGRRRCRWSGTSLEARTEGMGSGQDRAQLSESSADSSIG